MPAKLSDTFSKTYVKDITPALQAFSNIKALIQYKSKDIEFKDLSSGCFKNAFVLMMHISNHNGCTYDLKSIIKIDEEDAAANVDLGKEIMKIKSTLYDTGISTLDFFEVYKLLDTSYVYILESLDNANSLVYLSL